MIINLSSHLLLKPRCPLEKGKRLFFLMSFEKMLGVLLLIQCSLLWSTNDDLTNNHTYNAINWNSHFLLNVVLSTEDNEDLYRYWILMEVMVTRDDCYR